MLSFALGALLYREITGVFPFQGESSEDIHEQMRKLEDPVTRGSGPRDLR